jgi:glycosyltransferase involved in cell wall biosynthesis
MVWRHSAGLFNRATKSSYGDRVALPADFTLLQVVPELETGGAEQTTIDVARAVIAAGGRSLVATRGGRMVSRLEADGARLAQMPVQTKNPLVMLGNAARLVSLIRQEKVSIVHARSRAPAFSALGAAHATHTPFVATYHGVYRARTRLKRWYNAVMTRGDLVIANSNYTRNHVIAEHDLDPAKVVAIPRGVDLDRFNPSYVTPNRIEALRTAWGIGPTDTRARILLAGRLTAWKGHLTAVAAARRLREAGRRDFLMIFAGDDQGRTGYAADLTRAIAEGGLEDVVRLVGHCDDMPAAYLLSDFAIAPSTEPEAFGRTAVEPQVMGRPVIASNHGAVTETVVDGVTGWLAAPANDEAWAGGIGRALDLGPGKRLAIGEAGRKRCRELYSVEAMCDATLAAYERVLEARAA